MSRLNYAFLSLQLIATWIVVHLINPLRIAVDTYVATVAVDQISDDVANVIMARAVTTSSMLGSIHIVIVIAALIVIWLPTIIKCIKKVRGKYA